MLNRFRNVVIGAVSNLEANNLNNSPDINQKNHLAPKFPYGRPHFLTLDDEEVQMSADHRLRPIIHPTTPLPYNAGYAECVNAGKSKWNEDQAVVCKVVLTKVTTSDILGPRKYSIPYTYYGLFDGHAGVGAALCAANQLHHIIHVILQFCSIALHKDSQIDNFN